MSGVKFYVLRVDKPNINKFIGDVIEVLPTEVFEGSEVTKVRDNYVRVVVTNIEIDDEIVTELKTGLKRMIKPPQNDPFYTELFTNGIVTVDKDTVLNYIETVNNA